MGAVKKSMHCPTNKRGQPYRKKEDDKPELQGSQIFPDRKKQIDEDSTFHCQRVVC
jgi:hypothetical protein